MGLRGFVEGLRRSRVDNGTMRGSGWGEDYVRGVKRDVGGWINCDGGWRGNSGFNICWGVSQRVLDAFGRNCRHGCRMEMYSGAIAKSYMISSK